MCFKTTLKKALDHHSAGIAESHARRFHSAFQHFESAKAIYDELETNELLTSEQYASIGLGRAITTIACGVAERCRGDLTAARSRVDDAKRQLEIVHGTFSKNESDDWQSTASGMAWHAAMGRTLINAGALEFENGEHELAVQIWQQAEGHLLENNIHLLGSNSRPVNVAQAFRLYGNIIEASQFVDNQNVAADAFTNALQLLNQFRGIEQPKQIERARTTFAVRLRNIPEQQIQRLKSLLPPATFNGIIAILGEIGE